VEGEHRVAVVPDTIKRMVRDGLQVRVEAGAGEAAGFGDDRYADAGADLVRGTEVWTGADLLLKIQMPTAAEADRLSADIPIVGLFLPLFDHDGVRRLLARRVTAFSLDQLPRITRAQSMDVLSSMSTVSGYKAVLLAAATVGKFFPMLVTAAGTIAPAKVLVLGAGVAGLQAIATARRLGAVVSAFDVRAAVKEQVESLGARFIEEEEGPGGDAEDAGGYARELSADQHQRELDLIHRHITEVDVVITTALIPGRPAPELITEAMVRDMRAGATIVDLASETGGNCALTEPGQTVVRHGVTILGPLNLPASMPSDASQMYSKNMHTFVKHIVADGALHLDFEDEITGAACITRDGVVVNDRVRQAVEGGSAS